MNTDLPTWAMEMATPQDRVRALRAYDNGTIQITWPTTKTLRDWARQQGWPTPWFGFQDTFLKKTLESDDNFARALNESGIQVVILIEHHIVTDQRLQELDALYEDRSESGRPTSWGILVEELRE